MRYALLSVFVLFAFACAPARAQQNMADVVYGGAEGPSVMASVPAESNRSHTSAVQHELRARGYKITVDGKWGPKTRATVQKFQRKQGLPVTGRLDTATLTALQLNDWQ